MATTWYTLFDAPNTIKGSVAIAWRAIPAGTRILIEKPLITVPLLDPSSEATTPTSQGSEAEASCDNPTKNSRAFGMAQRRAVAEQIAAFSPEQLAIFKSLPQPRSKFSSSLGRVLNNLQPGGVGVMGAVFPDAGRFNHSCDHNAVRTWNATQGSCTIHTLTDIEAGEEITLGYLATQEANSRSRATYLARHWDFVCRCRLCEMREEERDRVDYLLDNIGRISRLIESEEEEGEGGVTERSRRKLCYIRQKVRLIEELGLWDGRLFQSFEEAFWTVIAHGDVARGDVFAQRTVKLMELRFGLDHSSTARMQRKWDNLARCAEFGGLSMDWKSTVNDIPEGLPAAEFEDWLWRQRTPGKGQCVSLSSQMSFPAFAQLPNKNALDPIYYSWTGGEKLGRRRHWCFLGEITGSNTYGDRELVLTEDVDGEEVSLAIAWDVEMSIEGGTKTVAVLYAEQQWLNPRTWGIVVDDPGMFKIFDASPKDLLDASEHAQKRPPEVDGVKRCHWCNKKRASLPCEGCGYFWYCDKDCRIDARNEKGHRKYCKILADTDLQGMLALDWNDCKKEVSFPFPVEVREEAER